MKKNLFIALLCILLTSCGDGKKEKASFAKGKFKEWAQTPPMGWNSWDCYDPTVKEHEVKANADYMEKYLISAMTRMLKSV